jgi:uncharacterized protein (TIGR00255 family)
VEIRASVTPDENAAPATINTTLVARVVQFQDLILKQVPTAQALSVADILHMPGVLNAASIDAAKVEQQLSTLLGNLLGSLKASREREGTALATILLNNCQQIETTVKELQGKLPDILAHIQGKLEERLTDALAGALSEKSTLTREEVTDRIRQEVTLYAVRMDVEEEMNRLLTHVNEVRRILEKGGAVGRRLDFIVQEMNREANTLGSKAVALEMTNTALSLKVVIEQMREQIQNLE